MGVYVCMYYVYLSQSLSPLYLCYREREACPENLTEVFHHTANNVYHSSTLIQFLFAIHMFNRRKFEGIYGWIPCNFLNEKHFLFNFSTLEPMISFFFYFYAKVKCNYTRLWVYENKMSSWNLIMQVVLSTLTCTHSTVITLLNNRFEVQVAFDHD